MYKDSFVHYITGIDSVDADHIKIVDILDRIRQLPSESDEVLKLANELKMSLKPRFLSEEMEMMSVKYPYLEYHKSLHIELHKKIEDKISWLERKSRCEHVCSDIIKAIEEHIDWHDMQFADFAKRLKK